LLEEIELCGGKEGREGPESMQLQTLYRVGIENEGPLNKKQLLGVKRNYSQSEKEGGGINPKPKFCQVGGTGASVPRIGVLGLDPTQQNKGGS